MLIAFSYVPYPPSPYKLIPYPPTVTLAAATVKLATMIPKSGISNV